MKKYNLLICLTLVLTIALSFASCGRSEQPADSTEETTPEPTSEAAPEPTFTLSADELYDLLIATKPVWEREQMISGTLIDLDFDGMPEFLLMSGGYSPSLTIFRFEGDILEEIKYIQSIYVPENVFFDFRVILPYTDENGLKSWVLPYIEYTGKYDEDIYYSEYYLSAFDFTGDNVIETIKFNSKINYNAEKREEYLNYGYVDAQFYIDGVEHLASQDKTDEFWNEMDRIVREHLEAITDDNPMGAGYPWSCGQYYPTPSQAEWEERKTDFLNSLLAVEPAYTLFPGVYENEWEILYNEQDWRKEENIGPALKKLAEAYFGGDESYFRSSDLYFENGGAMCKPVIYLYPTEPADISVRVDFPDGGKFTCTYPDYGDGWNVTAYPDGTIINKADGLEYSYLYWEGEGSVNWDFSSGFVVKGGDTASFLREKLAYLGLTPREYNEFIVYWLPLMQNNNYNLITFQTTAYEEIAKLYVSPQPDSVLRVFMAYAPLEDAVDIPEQKLQRFGRTGFSVIEWGGTCVE